MRNIRSAQLSNGFSLVEVLVASFFMLVLMLGVLPIFTRSLITNQMAYDNTRVVTFARSEMENYVQSPFDDPSATPVMNVPTTGSELETEQYFDKLTKTWIVGAPPAGTSYEWTKKVTIRQFHISAIDDQQLDEAEALQGTAHSGNVHLKQVLIEIQRGNESSLLGPPRTITLNTIRSN